MKFYDGSGIVNHGGLFTSQKKNCENNTQAFTLTQHKIFLCLSPEKTQKIGKTIEAILVLTVNI